MSHEMISQGQLPDGSVDYGHGVIGPSAADRLRADNIEGSLPALSGISQKTIFEIGTLGATSFMVAACGAQTPATHENQSNAPIITVAPTENPTPTPLPIGNVFSPEPTATPEPTKSPEPTATPEPTPELKTLESLLKFDGKPNKPNKKQVTNALNQVLKNNPDSLDDLWTKAVYLDGWAECSSTKVEEENIETTCELMIGKLYKNYTKFGDVAFYDVGRFLGAQAKSTLSKSGWDTLVANLTGNS